MFNDIVGRNKWKKIDLIDKGWSNDKKYHIVTYDDRHLLLRISSEETYASKKLEYEVIKRLSSLNFEMSAPSDFGKCKEGLYMLMKWVEGEDMETVLPSLSFIEQYNLGFEAGQILKKIHDLEIKFELFDWYEKFTKKMDIKIQMYNNCELKYDNGNLFIEYMHKTRALLKNRPLVLHHGDFHVGNMIYTKSRHVGIIDFNRFDFGDPWEEFNRIVWDVNVSPSFATGRLNGYFENEVPTDFFELLALYISTNTLSSLPWAIPFGEREIETMKRQASTTLEAYNNFENVIPKWYTETTDKLEANISNKSTNKKI